MSGKITANVIRIKTILNKKKLRFKLEVWRFQRWEVY